MPMARSGDDGPTKLDLTIAPPEIGFGKRGKGHASEVPVMTWRNPITCADQPSLAHSSIKAIWLQSGPIQFQYGEVPARSLEFSGFRWHFVLSPELCFMLSNALIRLQEALEIIDQHDAHLPGIYVANAIEALTNHIEALGVSCESDPLQAGASTH